MAGAPLCPMCGAYGPRWCELEDECGGVCPWVESDQHEHDCADDDEDSACGETDPLPASLCLAQLTRAGPERGKPCQYSVEGQERTRAAMVARSERIFAQIAEDAAKREAR